MADLIKKIKIKKQDGTFTDYIPIGAEAQNISTSDGESVQLKLNKKPYYYNNVAEMKTDTKLKAGDMAVTLGYYEANDGGAGEYNIVNGTNTDDGGSCHALNNNLYAKLIINEDLNVAQFGARSGSQYDATTAIQNAINYCISNHHSLTFDKIYYVNPQDTTIEDKVCLYIIGTGQYDHMYANDISFNFINRAKIQTTYNDNCTLLRINAGQLKFNKLWLVGVRGKTDLLNLGRANALDITEGFKTSYNYFEKIMLQQGNRGIYLEGASYYNSFNTGYIRDCETGLEIGFSRAEKAGLKQDSACNRNSFINFTFMADTQGINITYGDTNKFVNTNFEGVTYGIDLDDPNTHKTDFPIEPLYPTNDNVFVNTTFESITRTFRNNNNGTKVINTSTQYKPENWIIAPQVYIGGGEAAYSLEKFGRTYKICETTKPREGIQSWSTYDDSSNGIEARTFYDCIVDNTSGNVTGLNRQTVTFEIKEDSNIEGTLTTDTILCKGVGGMIFLSGKVKFQPTDQNAAIKLYFPEDKGWLNIEHSSFANIRPMMLPIIYADSQKKHFVICNWKTDCLEIEPPENGWTHAGKYNDIFLDLHGFRRNNSL